MGNIKSFNATVELAKWLALQNAKTCQVGTTAGTGSVPAGLRAVAIVKTSANTDIVSVTMSDGTAYVMTEKGETFADAASDGGTLPAYLFGGTGTVKWHGIK